VNFSLLLRSVLSFLLAAALVVMLPPVAGQASVHRNTFQARVIYIDDGDTIDVDTNHDGRKDARIRLLGLDAPEKGLCGAAAATRALSSLVFHKTVTLTSQSGKTGLMNRLERRVLVNVGGVQVDATTYLLERGLAVWMPRDGESAHDASDHAAAERAAQAQIGWFNEDRCGAGPGANGSLSMQVQYLADQTHTKSVNQRRNEEFIRIRNDSAAPINVSHWTLRVGNTRINRVPAGGAIPPGQALTVHVGVGNDTLLDRYLNSNHSMLANANLDGGPLVGSGSYLIDPNDDIRAQMSWPCTVSCTSPRGALVISQVMWNPPGNEADNLNSEYVNITNSANAPIRFGDTVLEIYPWVLEFPTDLFLNPGETITVHAGHGPDSRLDKFMGARVPPLQDFGGRVLLRTYDAVVIDCFAWGHGHCPAGS
jgi:endonuclease YncB( thermonuclease family)